VRVIEGRLGNGISENRMKIKLTNKESSRDWKELKRYKQDGMISTKTHSNKQELHAFYTLKLYVTIVKQN
jgi:hypothetical protein